MSFVSVRSQATRVESIAVTMKNKAASIRGSYKEAVRLAGGNVQERVGARRLENIYRITARKLVAFAEYELLDHKLSGMQMTKKRAGKAALIGGLGFAGGTLGLSALTATTLGSQFVMGYSILMGGKTILDVVKPESRKEIREHPGKFAKGVAGALVLRLTGPVASTCGAFTDLGLSLVAREAQVKLSPAITTFFKGYRLGNLAVTVFEELLSNSVKIARAQEQPSQGPACTNVDNSYCACGNDWKVTTVQPEDTIYKIGRREVGLPDASLNAFHHLVDAYSSQLNLDVIHASDKFPIPHSIQVHPGACTAAELASTAIASGTASSQALGVGTGSFSSTGEGGNVIKIPDVPLKEIGNFVSQLSVDALIVMGLGALIRFAGGHLPGRRK